VPDGCGEFAWSKPSCSPRSTVTVKGRTATTTATASSTTTTTCPPSRSGSFAWHSSGPDPTVESPEELRRAGVDLAPFGKAGDWTPYRVTP
jgi:hypothetical protein